MKLLFLAMMSTSWAFYTDEDGDGSPAFIDCNDADPQINPYAMEIPNDGIDQNCDNLELCPLDADLDGYGATQGPYLTSASLRCEEIGTYTLVTGDCDDNNSAVNPTAAELVADGIDQNCDGVELCFSDNDLDGIGSFAIAPGDLVCQGLGVSDRFDDCDDTNDSIHPNANEIPNDGIDQDCNGSDLVGCYLDGDGDGYGGDTIIYAPNGCDAEPAYTLVTGDCDDNNSAVNPTAVELVADGIDQDCDGGELCFSDNDFDGVGSFAIAPGDLACQGMGVSDRSDDCDDTDSSRSPLQTEIECDGVDQDCDGLADDNPDVDADGYGACADDCDDSEPNVNPGASEVLCNGVDDDCSPTTPDRIDSDTDGVSICDGDCDDGNPDISPLLDEVLCSGIDEDCDPFTADAPDDDDDGLGVCDDDCDDDDPAVNPTVPEVPCNGVDDDCDPSTPDGCIDSADTGLRTDTSGVDTATDTAGGTDTALPPTTTPPGTPTTTTSTPATTAGTDAKAVAPKEPTYGFGCRATPHSPSWLGLWLLPLLGARRR